MMSGLIVIYIIIAFVSALEANWPRVLYWISAGLLTTSILWGTR